VSNLVDIENSQIAFIGDFCRMNPHAAIRQEFFGKELGCMVGDSQLFMGKRSNQLHNPYLERFFRTMENVSKFEYRYMNCRGSYAFGKGCFERHFGFRIAGG